MFYYALAEHLGYASPSQMLGEMTSLEVTEWQAYFRIRKREAEKEQAKARAKSKARGGRH